MMRAGVVTLIGESPEARGVLEEATENLRKVYCTEKSIGQTEIYQARGLGLNPEVKLVLAHDFEYQGESTCEYKGVRWRILRTYVTETDGIELTLERMRQNAAEPVTAEAEPEPETEPAGEGG